jgi:hypothetical protein
VSPSLRCCVALRRMERVSPPRCDAFKGKDEGGEPPRCVALKEENEEGFSLLVSLRCEGRGRGG